MDDRSLTKTAGGRTALRSLGLALCCASASPMAAGVAAQAPSTDILLARLELDGARVETGGWLNVTNRQGYDNQPAFTRDGTSLLYTSQRQGQTDIYRYDLESGAISRLTLTPESEYSPTPMPAGGRFSTIRVEADSTQRLWSFALDGTDPRVVFPDIVPVGYHAWVDAELAALFVLGAPPSLVTARPGPGGGVVRASDVGRSLHPVPGRRAVSFLHRNEAGRWISVLDPETGTIARLAPALEGSEDFAWTPTGVLLMGQGDRLNAFDPLTDEEWRPVADLTVAGIDSISRIAVSPDGRWVAVVAAIP